MSDQPPTTGRIFVSHSTPDRRIAHKLCEHFEQNGMKCWIAPRDIPPGTKYDEEIVRGLDRCDSLLLVLSKSAVASEHVEREVYLARERNLRVVPIRIEEAALSESLQYQIGRAQWIDLKPRPTDVDLVAVVDEFKETGAGNSASRHSMSSRVRIKILAGAAMLVFLLLTATFITSRLGLKDQNGTPLDQGVTRDFDDYPAAEVLSEAFHGNPPNAEAGPFDLTLAFEVMGRREGTNESTPVADGDHLNSIVDKYWIELRPESSGYLYVFQVDTRGKIAWLHPKNTSPYSLGSNPVRSSQTIRIPPGDEELFLDTNRGVELIYAVFSAIEWDRLENKLNASQHLSNSGSGPFIKIPFRDAESRGIGGTTGGTKIDLEIRRATEFRSTESVLILRRWFHHD